MRSVKFTNINVKRFAFGTASLINPERAIQPGIIKILQNNSSTLRRWLQKNQ